MNYDILIVGAGFSGATLARLYAENTRKRILVIEKRNHIAGNCYDEVNKWGIRMAKYGAHLFHTNRKDVWNFVQPFDTWIPWEHKVLAQYNPNQYAPVPLCIPSIQKVWDPSVNTPEKMDEWVRKYGGIGMNGEMKKWCNSEESAIARVGRLAYNMFFRDYTKKHWGCMASDLDASVLERIPIRYNWDDRYFTDTYQALPENGYTTVIKNMLNHPQIHVMLDINYLNCEESFQGIPLIFYTGPVDDWCITRGGMVRLGYRSVRFESEDVELDDAGSFVLPASVVNEPRWDIPYTRTVESKRFLNQVGYVSTIVREYGSAEGEPYYPIPTKENQKQYQAYLDFIQKEQEHAKQQIHFVGRLATYKYINMDQAIGNAIDLFHQFSTV